MRIGIIGGLDRNEAPLSRIAEKHGHELEFHTGHTGGNGSKTIERLIDRVDAIIVPTDVNSHGAVQLARKIARKRNRLCWLVRKCGATRFEELLGEITGSGSALARACLM